MHLVEKNFIDNNNEKEIRVTTGGLINERNGKIIMELLTNGGIRIDGKKSITYCLKMLEKMFDHIEENTMKKKCFHI